MTGEPVERVEPVDEVEALFHQALELPTGDRDAFLDDACDDPALRRTIRALLDEDAAAAAYFEGLARRAGSLPAVADRRPERDALAGRRIGPYRLEREVGRGGTSVVYTASRVDGAFHREVAVKVLTRRSGGAGLRERFRREQQLLSGLTHPYIAALYDGGVTEDGYPYFVMEMVDGLPLDRYCDDLRLTVDRRLRLFLTVLDSVHHAHRNLIIHRDLKPSNILVSRDGTVKLIDFGIARLVGGDDVTGHDATTRMMGRWLTPEYSAPEQVRGERTTTATDVYQLGVVLYGLLTGHHPVPAAAAGSLYLTEKAVCETEPPAPSRAVSQPFRRPGAPPTVRTSEEIGRSRGMEVRQLRERLRGDLDAIVLRALQKDPTLRYGSAEAFAEDIRRYLAGLPVEAREGKLRYRARKFIGRNRIPVAVGVAMVLMLVTGAALHTSRVQDERDVARLEAAKARTVTEFMLDLFQASNPEEARGEALTASALLARGVERAEALADEPAVQAEMLVTMARAYHGVAEFERSDELVHRSLEIRRRHFPPDHPAIAHSLAHVGWAKLRLAEYPEAAAVFAEAMAIQRGALGPDDAELANSLHGLALALNGLGQVDAGLERLHEAQAIRHRAFAGAPHVETANGLNDLSILLRVTGDLAGAERTLVAALAMRRDILPDGHPDIAKSAQFLGSLLHRMERYDEAEPLYLDALATRQRSLGLEHPATLSTVRSLAALYGDWGRPAESGPYAALLETVGSARAPPVTR